MPTTKLSEATLPEDFTFETAKERLLSLDEIEPLQYQPNSVHHVLDSSLYESIKHVGLQNPLVVAEVPNEKVFVPIAGGNSRLQVLSRLYDETGEESFATVQCVVSEWPGLARAQLAHVITNHVHKRYSFASRAIAIVHIVDSERNSKPSKTMPQRDAVLFLVSNGYPISQSAFSYMEYLVHRLQPRVSTEVLNKLSMIDVRELREIETKANEHWQDQIELSANFKELYARLLKEAASQSTEVEDLIERVRYKANYLGEISGLEPYYGLDELVSHDDGNPVASTDPVNRSLGPVLVEKTTESNRDEITKTSSSDGVNQPDCNTTLSSNDTVSKEREVIAQRTIGELRESAWTAASHLCNSYNLNKCIINVSTQFGYQIVAKPDCDSSTTQYQLWNYLDVFAGSHDRPLDVTVWTELNDEDWRALIDLWDAVRLIRKNRRTDHQNLSQVVALQDKLTGE